MPASSCPPQETRRKHITSKRTIAAVFFIYDISLIPIYYILLVIDFMRARPVRPIAQKTVLAPLQRLIYNLPMPGITTATNV
jgi:hypothetical protein